MIQYATKDELDILKEEMMILKNHLSQNEVINQEMLDVTFRHKVKSNTNSRMSSLIGMVACLFISGSALYAHYVKDTYSTWYTMVTVLWGLFCFGICVQSFILNTREHLLNTPLTESVSEIMKWKKQNSTRTILGIIGVSIWLPCTLYETRNDIFNNMEHLIAVVLLVGIVLIRTFSYLYRVNTTINELLNEISELKK